MSGAALRLPLALPLATVTLGEIQAGIELAREQDPAKASEIEAWLDLREHQFVIC